LVRDVLWQGELTHFVVDVNGASIRVVATNPPVLPSRGEKLEMFFAPADASLVVEDGHV
jgi:hypothetical protein